MIGMLSALLLEHNVDVSRKFYQYNVVEHAAAAQIGQCPLQYSAFHKNLWDFWPDNTKIDAVLTTTHNLFLSY